MKISMIAAMGKNKVIGKDNDIPWHLPDDFKYFKKMTEHHYVIMGRKNWESLPHKFQPLPNRPNIVMTKQNTYTAKDAEVVHTLEDALTIARKNDEQEAFIIGGGQIYELALKKADKIYLTEINGTFDGDAKFPTFSKDKWKEVSREHHPQDEKHDYSFDYVIYEKV